MAKRTKRPRQNETPPPRALPLSCALQWVLIGALGIGVVALAIYATFDGTTDVTVPALSAAARQGQALFAAPCAECHGENATAGDRGPPLIHDTDNPGHHGDRAFHRAATPRGVRQHHWSHGNMPPQPSVSRADMGGIIRFVRETQAANDIVYRPHRR